MKPSTIAQIRIELLTAILVFLGLIIVALVIYIYRDYKKHKLPLIQADPRAKYSVVHHVRMVTIPMLRYRINVKFERNNHVSRY